MVLPAQWLRFGGVVLERHKSVLSSFTCSQGIPRWTLSPVNVIDEKSEIITACLTHDFGTIRRLFEERSASPYDVDSTGRNLLGFIAVGLQFQIYKGKHETIQMRLDEVEAIIAMMIDYGVDSGCMNLHDSNSVYLSAQCWSETCLEVPVNASLEEHGNFLVRKLLRSAKTDPFSTTDAYVRIGPEGGHEVVDFPGMVRGFPPEPMTKLQLDVFMTQNEWQLVWSSWQLNELSSVRSLEPLDRESDVRSYVAFWVTSDAEIIRKLLDSKLDLLGAFLNLNLLHLEPAADHSVIDALNVAIHQGGEVIALLTEHSYYSHEREPWIRHRFKKLVLIECWLTKVFQLLITHGVTYMADSDVVNELCQHARKHNARTLYAWTKALGLCAKENSPLPGSRLNNFVSTDDSVATGSVTTEVLEIDDDWETEDTDVEESGWETEEEHEEGYMLEIAIEKKEDDARNPNLRDKDRHTCCKALEDYDEGYWSHVYPRIMRSKMDSGAKKHEESTLRKLTRHVRDLMAVPLLGG
ncbi:hypothetical protein EV356DRAFT_537890 [Viridothelium virens]|uniref:Uncharacterized protein n=1 Tax=Viridothelium virens TaxID=1048519 RepID=A0A6A6GSP6_VIRVR|nr:hypothetical protein EV356DRAFT_537890 [Viridothelium virens]